MLLETEQAYIWRGPMATAPEQSPGEAYTHGYDEHARRNLNRRSAAVDAAFLLPHLRPGMSLLDCGCGTGRIPVGLAAAVAPGEVVGVDIGSVQVEAARVLAAEEGLT